jgi:hypothetical protein
MQRRIEERVEAEHAPVAQEGRLPGQLAQWRDGQRDHQKAQRPQPQPVFDLGDGVGAQAAAAGQQLLPDLPAQDCGRCQRQQMDEGLGGKQCTGTGTPGRSAHQNHFFRSMPAYRLPT